MDIEALAGGSVNIQGAVLQGRSLGHVGLAGGILAIAVGGAAVVSAVAPNFLIEGDGLVVVVDGILQLGDILHEATGKRSARIGQGQSRTAGRSLADIAAGVRVEGRSDFLHGTVGLVGNLIPDVLAHGLQAAGSQLGALLGQDKPLAVGDDLAGPGPLVIGIELVLDFTLVGVNQGLGGTVVLAHHNSSDDVTVVVVQSIGAAGVGLQVSAVIIDLALDVVGVPGHQVHISDTSGDAVHAADNADVGLSGNDGCIAIVRIIDGIIDSVRSNLTVGRNLLQLRHDVNGLVVAVDILGSGSLQGSVLVVDLLAGGARSRSDRAVSGGSKGLVIVILAGLVLAGLVGILLDLSQGVDAVLVHGVGTPGVPQRAGGELSTISEGNGVSSTLTALLVEGNAVGQIHGELHEGSVGQDTGGLGGLTLQVAGGQIDAGEEDVVVHSVNDLHADQVAIGVQVHIVLGILQLLSSADAGVVVQGVAVVLHGGVVVVLSTVAHHIAVPGEAVQSNSSQDLGIRDGLDVAVRGSHQEDVVLLDILDSEVVARDLQGLGLTRLASHLAGAGVLVEDLVVAAAVAGQGIDFQGDLVLLLVVVRGGLSQVGVDHGHVDFLGVSIHEHLSQNALAGLAHARLVGLGHVGLIKIGVSLAGSIGLQHSVVVSGAGLLIDGHTVDGDVKAVVLDGVGAQQVIQVLAGDLSGPLLVQQLLLHVGADGLAVILPVAGRRR